MLDGDPALNAWALSWVSKSLVSDWFNLLNGNAFYPHQASITLSEHMTALAIFNLPVRLFTDNPWISYNFAILCAYLLSAIGGYKLLTELTHSRLAGLWGGIFWAFCFFRVHHIGHLQILAYQWFPFVALYLIRTLNNPTITHASLLAFFFILQALTSWYLAVIISFVVLIIFICNLKPSEFSRQYLWTFTYSAALVLIAVLPFALAYLVAFRDSSLGDRLAGIHSLGDQVMLSDFFVPPSSTYPGALIPENKYWLWGENTLYIGYSACFLALVGLWRCWRENRRMALTAIVLVIAGFILARGYTSPSWGIKLPLYYLAQAFPLFAAIRATQRYALLIYFGILILSGYGVVQLIHARSTFMRGLVVTGFSLLFLIEVYPFKLPFGKPLHYTPSALDREISRLVFAKGGRPVILHFPIYSAMPGYPTAEATYMADSTMHWGNIVNGFSGAEPLGFKADMETLNRLPSEQARELLKKYGVTILAIHQPLSAEQKKEIRNFYTNSAQGEIKNIGNDELLVFLK